MNEVTAKSRRLVALFSATTHEIPITSAYSLEDPAENSRKSGDFLHRAGFGD
jgi:hypothetical protein